MNPIRTDIDIKVLSLDFNIFQKDFLTTQESSKVY